MSPQIRRVALLTDGIHPFVTGGMQKHSYYLLSHLLRSGIEVVLAHCGGGKGSIADHLPAGVDTSRLEEIVVPFGSPDKLPGSYIRQSRAYGRALARELSALEPVQYIYAQGFTAWGIVEAKGRGEDWPTLGINFHGLEMYQYARGLKSKMIQYVFRPFVKWHCQQADIVYSLGGKLTSILTELVDETKVRVIPIGVEEDWLIDEKLLSTTAKPLRVAFVGRYERRKGTQELNEVMKVLAGHEVTFDLIGPIPQSKRLSQSNVVYHGLLKKEEDIRAILDQCQVMVVPSLAEGMPTVILEAMARGLAIIASDVGAVATEVDESNGLLISAGDPVGLRSALDQLMSCSPEALLALRRSSRTKVEDRFLWNHIISLTIEQMESDYI